MTRALIPAAVIAVLMALAGCARTNADGSPVKATIPKSGGYDAT